MNSAPPDGTTAPSALPMAPAAQVDNDTRPQLVAGDILYGADEIALFLFGGRKHRRRVYNLVEADRLPVFRIGISICARRSVLLDWIADQERRSVFAG